MDTEKCNLYRRDKNAPLRLSGAFVLFLVATRVYKPGSVLTAIYLGLQLLAGSSRLLGTVGQTYVFLHGVASG